MDPQRCVEAGGVSSSNSSSSSSSSSTSVQAHDRSDSVKRGTGGSESCTAKYDTGDCECGTKGHNSGDSESGSIKHNVDNKLNAKCDSGSMKGVPDDIGGSKIQSTKLDLGSNESDNVDTKLEYNNSESSRLYPGNGTGTESRTRLILSQRDIAELNATCSDESECWQKASILQLSSDHEQEITSLLEGGETVDNSHVPKGVGDGTLGSGCNLEEHQGSSSDFKKQVEVGYNERTKLTVQVSDTDTGKQIEQSSGDDCADKADRSNSNNVMRQREESNISDVGKQTCEASSNGGMKEIEDNSGNDLKMTGQAINSTDCKQIREKSSDEGLEEETEKSIINDKEREEEEDIISNDSDVEMDDTRSDEPSEDLHTINLGKICRICGEMTVKYDGPKKGVPKQEIVKHVKKVWNVDISNESADVYPINVCLSCERKIKRIYLKVSKRKKCELFRDKPAEFVEHSGSDCSVCLLKEENPLPVLSSKSLQENVSLAGEDGLETVTKNSPRTQAHESRRNTTRKRSREELRDAFQSVGSQTEEIATLESITGLEEHDYTQEEALRQYLVMPKKTGSRTPYQKQSLCSVNAKYIRQDRLKPLISHIDKFCQVHKEDKIDVMFFLLIQTLRDASDRARENLVTDIWCKKNSVGVSLTDEECLAKRILLKQTKEQYRKEYCYYKEKLDKSVLKPPFIIDRLEKTYFPEHLQYFVTDGEAGPLIYQHEKSTHPSHFTITDSLETKGEGARGGSLVGARWHYFDAVAKTLEELSCYTENNIQELDEDTCIHVDVMDYFEEKRDMTSLADKSTDGPGTGGRVGQCKMMTYFFGVQSMQAVVENMVTPLYKASSVTTLFRPLMKAIVSEGSAISPTYTAIEMERAAMADKVFHITLPGGTSLRFMVNFTNSTAEIRKDYRNTIGLSLSSFKKVPVAINRYGSVCLELKRSWLASSPRLVHISQVTNCRTKCSRCGEQGHNVRKCSVPSDGGRDGTDLRRRRKKQRTVPPSPYPAVPSQTLQPLTRSMKVMEMAPPPLPPPPPPPPPPSSSPPQQQQQQQHEQQQQQQQPHQQQQQPQQQQHPSCPAIPDASNNIGQDETTIIRNTDQILWACQGLVASSATQDTQVLIPTPAASSSSVQYPSVPQRTQTSPAPVYVWAYTVMQPTHNGTQQATPEQLSLVPPAQQSTPPLTVMHHPSAPHHTTPQPHHQVVGTAGTHQQGSQSDVLQSSQQQLPVLHQPQQQQTASSQHLPVIQQQQQQPPTSHQQITVGHHQSGQPETSQPSQQQQLHVIHQQTRQVPTSQASQHLHVMHQQTRQPEAPQQLPVIHQQTSRQAAPHLTQLQQLSQKTTPQINLIPQQMSVVHQQAAAPQPSLSPVQQQQRVSHQATLTHQTQLHSVDTTQPQQVIHPQTSSIQPVLDTNWQPQ